MNPKKIAIVAPSGIPDSAALAASIEMTGAPFGHGSSNIVWPYGKPAEITQHTIAYHGLAQS